METLTDIRRGVKESGGGTVQQFYDLSPYPTLPKIIQEMSDDIRRLLNPDNDWFLFGLNIYMIHRFPKEPDRFIPSFYFDAKNPPRSVLTNGILRVVDLSSAFSFRAQNIISVMGQIADIHPEEIGGVLPLPQALEELSNPYYLVSTKANIEATPQNNPRLVIKPIMEDLLDFTSLEINKLRRVKGKLSRIFPI